MPRQRRLVTWGAILAQGYAIYALWTRSLVWPVMWPSGPILYFDVWLLYVLGYIVQSAMLSAEFVRKTELESDQAAARRIQRTLIPQQTEAPDGYETETFYQPFRDVGGDYFDVIPLGENTTLLALADVSGKGMPAALLAANIQALVRVFADEHRLPVEMVRRINAHLCRHSPEDRFATAVFVVVSHDSGQLTYVNAGHNPPIVASGGSSVFLGATGPPLGMFMDADYEAAVAVLPRGGSLLLFTDGLTDSIPGDDPNSRLESALKGPTGATISGLKAVMDPNLTGDDVTMLLLKRGSESAPPPSARAGGSRPS
jgi:hypothetical protein